MGRNLGCLIVVFGTVTGCASPTSRFARLEAPQRHIRLANASLELETSTTHGSEPGLQGPRPVDHYIALALERNPEIHAARNQVAAQTQVVPQATALDDPMLADTFMPISAHGLQTAAGRATNTLTLTQKFPWFGTLSTRGVVAEQEVKMALARQAQAELKVIEDVRLAYYELYFYQRAIEITQENQQLLGVLLQIADARYRTGDTSQQDILRIQVELDRIDDRLIDLSRALEQSQADLVRLVREHPDAKPEVINEIVSSSMPADINRLYDLAIRCRPELEERLAAIVRDQYKEELARLKFYPDVTVGLGWQSLTTNAALSGVANGNDNFMFTVGINVPIWRDKLQAGVGESFHRVMETTQRYEAARDDTFRQVRRLTAQATATDEQIALYRDNILPKADQTLQVSMAEYRVGSVTFVQVLDNWMQHLSFEMQLARLEANREQALASLERAVGCAITDEGIPPSIETSHTPPDPLRNKD